MNSNNKIKSKTAETGHGFDFTYSQKYLWAIFWGALILRLIYLWQVHGEFWFSHPMLDAEHYDEWAQRIAKGDWIGKEVFFMSPGYPYFLAVLYKLFGHSIILVALLQAVMGSLSCALIYKITQKIFGFKEALLASIVYAAYGPAIFHDSILVKVSLINFLNLLMIFFLLKADQEKENLPIFLGGLMLGLSAQLRPTVMIFTPLVLFWLTGTSLFKDLRRRIKSVMLFCLGIIVVSMPVALRNYWVGKQLILTTAHGGINFYLGNHPDFDGTYTGLPFARTDPRYEQQDYKREAVKRSGKQLTDKEASDFWYNETWNYILKNPAKWVGQLWKKFVVFWNNYEYPINIDYNFFKRRDRTILNLPLVNYSFIATTAFLGMLLSLLVIVKRGAGIHVYENRMDPRRQYSGMTEEKVCHSRENGNPSFLKQNRESPTSSLSLFSSMQFFLNEFSNPVGLLWFYFITYLAGGILFFVVTEYRMPVVPVLTVFSGKGLIWLWQKWKDRHLVTLGVVFLLCALFFGFTQVRIPTSSNCTEEYNLAQYLMTQKKFNEAIEELEKAVIECPAYLDAQVSLARAYMQIGELEKSFRQIKIAYQLSPNDSRVNFQLGNLYFSRKEYKNAVQCYEKALNSDQIDKPVLTEIHTNMGNALARLNRDQEAINHYLKALQFDPTSATTYHNLAFIYLKNKDHVSAINCYKKAVEFKPDYFNAVIKLARIYIDGKKYEEALPYVEQADRLVPDHPQVQSYMEICRKKTGHP